MFGVDVGDQAAKQAGALDIQARALNWCRLKVKSLLQRVMTSCNRPEVLNSVPTWEGWIVTSILKLNCMEEVSFQDYRSLVDTFWNEDFKSLTDNGSNME